MLEPTPNPTPATAEPQAGPGWYLARDGNDKVSPWWYDGRCLRIREGDRLECDPADYTDFRPLSVQPGPSTEVETVEQLRTELQRLINYAVTCKTKNQIAWMQEFAEYINHAAEVLGDEDRCVFGREQFKIVRPANR